MVCLIFSGRKKTTNEASWSEINRNGLHSLEESLDLEDTNITVKELQLVWYVGIFIINSYPTSLQGLGFYVTLSMTGLGDH